MAADLPWWLQGYTVVRPLNDEGEWLVAWPLTFGRGRVAVVNEGGPTEFY